MQIAPFPPFSTVKTRPRNRRKPRTVSSGPVTLKLYCYRWYSKRHRKRCKSWAITWRDALGRRQRERHADLQVAEARAYQLATDIANGQISMQSFTQADRARFEYLRRLEARAGVPLEQLVLDAVEAREVLAHGHQAVTLQQTAQSYSTQHATQATCPACPDILEEMLRVRKQDGLSQNTLDDYDSRLGKFAKAFTGPLLSITAAQLDTWLSSLNVSRRTRNNYRGNLVDLYAFARRRGYVPKNHNPIDDVPRVKNEDVKIEIFTPEELTKLLASAPDNLVPYLAIAAFAGVRQAEMCCPGAPVLDWRDIDLEARDLRVRKAVARKIGVARIVPIQDNLLAWLRPHVRPNGPVCALAAHADRPLANVTNALLKLAARVGVPWKDNGLRKSFISYRLAVCHNIGTVAREAGTSPEKIRTNYEKAAPEREGLRWFKIHPQNADILQLPLFA